MKAKLLLAALVLISAGAMAQQPEQSRDRSNEAVQTQNRSEEAVQARENIESPEAQEALQNAEQRRNAGIEKGKSTKEEALQNRNRATEKREAAQSRRQAARQETQRVENRSGARPDGAGQATGEAQRSQQSNSKRKR
jgi:hypothetical protein